MNKRKIGNYYEQKAINYLVEKGYVLVDKNYYTDISELDIVSKDLDYLVFKEVKFRSNNQFGLGCEAVTKKKQNTIINVAKFYMYNNKISFDTKIRFDVLSVDKHSITLFKKCFPIKKEIKMKIALIGDRPTGKLHIGHLVGSLERRLELQRDKDFKDIYIMLADSQALTDNADNPDKVRYNIIQVLLDYLSIGLNPDRITFCIQSELPALTELTFFYLNLVTTARLERNPTVKNEIHLRGFNNTGLPVGFYIYPISQAADITAFKENYVPVGDDQKPMLEQTRDIVQKFNSVYGETLVIPEILLPKDKVGKRLVGIDGQAKMSKSLNNAIFLSDKEDILRQKIMSMFTDPEHIKAIDKGKVEGNAVFTYLDEFCKKEHFQKYLNDYSSLDEMKQHYKDGGLGDVKCKIFLFNILNEKLSIYRENRNKWIDRIDEVYDIIFEGTKKAKRITDDTCEKVKAAMRIDYFF